MNIGKVQNNINFKSVNQSKSAEPIVEKYIEKENSRPGNYGWPRFCIEGALYKMNNNNKYYAPNEDFVIDVKLRQGRGGNDLQFKLRKEGEDMPLCDADYSDWSLFSNHIDYHTFTDVLDRLGMKFDRILFEQYCDKLNES